MGAVVYQKWFAIRLSISIAKVDKRPAIPHFSTMSLSSDFKSLLPSPPDGGARLSKSRFLAGLQCLKRLYLEVHAPELATEPDAHQQAILDMGTEIGELARRRFPGGMLVTAGFRRPTEALRQTAELLANPLVPAVFEAAIEWDRVLVRADILARKSEPDSVGAVWNLIEVKSTARVKPVHLSDLAVQTYVLEGAGMPLAGIFLLRINTRYVHEGGEIDFDALFTLEDVTELVRPRLPEVRARLAEMKTMLAGSMPAIEPGAHCLSPYECPFWQHCTKDKPTRWIQNLPGSGNAIRSLLKLGVETIDDIPHEFQLTVLQRRVKDGTEWISPQLMALLERVDYPVHHVDFETIMTAIPRYAGTRPFQVIPTQWSNHIESQDGEIRHEEYLCCDPVDPRLTFVQTLLESVGSEGSICVYSPYERTVLESLAAVFPQYEKALHSVINRLWDLLPIIREEYYHPAFQGSFSIKSVLPALVPNLRYDDLEIRDGGVAAQAYVRMVFNESDWVEKIRLRDALLQYCAHDTRALLEVRRALLRLVRTTGME